MNSETRYDVVIVGTGFSGLCMAIKLREAGIRNVLLLERASTLGGTWRDNCYPGAACDVPSNLYSFSFEPSPSWSRVYGTQGEILNYLQHCARKYELEPLTRFGTEVTGAVFDATLGQWQITCQDGTHIHSRVLVSGCGAFSKPALPDIPGIESFQGDVIHTARWNPNYSLTGKRVAVIGTGASAIQVVPTIAPSVDHLTLFQRTPPWILPKDDRPTRPIERWLYRHVPLSQRAIRELRYWTQELRVPAFTGHAPGLMTVPHRAALRHLRTQVRDPALRRALTPNYKIGCKRILLSNDYYPALVRPNVSLITAGISQVTATGLKDQSGHPHQVDTIICATGFHIADDLAPFPISGVAGQTLDTTWRAQQGAEAYLGTAIHGFPNFFTVTGPNTGVGHTSMVYMIEAGTRYVVQGIQQILERPAPVFLDLRAAVQRRFNSELQRRLAKTVWITGGCMSWYNTQDGKNTSLWPGQTFEYRQRTAHFDVNDYILHASPERG